MAELLIELLSEEIPARMQVQAAADLGRLLGERIAASGLAPAEIRSYATPRRLACVVKGLPRRTPDVTEERKGPRVGAPEVAIQGFLTANGLASLDACVVRTIGKAEFHVLALHRPGGATADLVPGWVQGVVASFPWPKSMRWGRSRRSWVRPLHRALCVFAAEPIAFDLDFDGVRVPTGAVTEGHRFLAPAPFEVAGYSDYAARLVGARVLLDPALRRRVILQRASTLAEAAGLRLKDDPGLLDEVTGLVEWPVPLLGRIDDAFMDVPPEVLTTSMRTHQKYFACLAPDGSLAPRFVAVANIEAPDGGAAIVAGNERVLRARLSDARFFWDTDRAVALEDRLPALASVTFHAKLGTLRQKVERIEALAASLATHIPGCDADDARAAARLAKADLTSGMVGEFPELQGVMGRYYALMQGVPERVADAIRDHWQPLGPNTPCPTAPVSVAVALADKLDTLAGFFAIGEKPTGSKDPYALRRATLGVIRLIVDNGLRLPLREALARATGSYLNQDGNGVREGLRAQVDNDELATAVDPVDFVRVIARVYWGHRITDYFAERLKVGLKDRGVRHDLITAAFGAVRPGGAVEDDVVRLLARVEALGRFLGSEDGANLLTAFRRAANILKIEEKKDGRHYDGAVDPAALVLAEETALAAALDTVAPAVTAALNGEDFAGAMAALARLRAPVDAFFADVTVNAEDPALRRNRLGLLAAIRATMAPVADFAAVEG